MVTEAQLALLFNRLQEKINYLQDHAVALERTIERQEIEKQALQDTISDYKKRVRTLEKNQLNPKQSFTKSFKFGNVVKENQADPAGHTELKQKLDEYIREIEQLIAHLSTLS